MREVKCLNEIEFAEIICDILKTKEFGGYKLSDEMCEALCIARRYVTCRNSKIGQYKCSVPILFSSQSEIKPFCVFCVDTCLQDEISNLVKKEGIIIIGSCCGHGEKTPFIQVSDQSVNKMLKIGYEMLPIDDYRNGKNCFYPKTKL